MKKSFFIIILSVIATISYSQKKKTTTSKNKDITAIHPVEDGKVENGKYICNLFKWQIPILDGYTIITDEEIEEREKKGLVVVERISPNHSKTDRATNLISFERHSFVSFRANYQLLPNQKMTLEEQKSVTAKFLEDAQKIQGLQATTVKSNLKIGNYDFFKVLLEIYHPQLKLTAYQEFYCAYINNFLFTGIIAYMDEYDGKILRNNFFKSMEQNN